MREWLGHLIITIYAIIRQGRRTPAGWLATPGHPPTLESEQLLKVFFADHGTKDNLLATPAAIRKWAEAQKARNTTISRGYLAGLGPFPERAAVLALIGRFLTRLRRLRRHQRVTADA
jgi:hypothetical protein